MHYEMHKKWLIIIDTFWMLWLTMTEELMQMQNRILYVVLWFLKWNCCYYAGFSLCHYIIYVDLFLCSVGCVQNVESWFILCKLFIHSFCQLNGISKKINLLKGLLYFKLKVTFLTSHFQIPPLPPPSQFTKLQFNKN